MEYRHNPPTLEEVRAERPVLRNPVREVKLSLTPLERFALSITHKVGTIGFFFLLTFWTIGWLVWNLWAPIHLKFDPAPAFVIWLFTSNVLQLILLPLIMVGQNLEGKVAEERAKADFEVNKKAEKEIEVIIAHMENQNELILELSRKIDRK
jgi:uncharacterized membrane protein